MNALATRVAASNGSIRWSRILPLLLALVVAGWFRCEPRWLQMWVSAGLVWIACKWAMAEGDPAFAKARPVHRFFWWLWPGMDPKPFHTAGKVEPPGATDIPQGGGWILVGGLLFLELAPWLIAVHPLAGGWIAWAGIILVLHFGLFHLLAVLLLRIGTPVEPIMRNPLAAQSVAEFWGQRWNHAFQQIAQRLLFRPVARAAGARAAMLVVFLVSGLVHELVITVPAGDGYGLPTLYFLIQGFALVAEKSRVGRALGLGRGWSGRIFALLVVIGPVAALFPPQFFRAVILPFVAVVSSLLS